MEALHDVSELPEDYSFYPSRRLGEGKNNARRPTRYSG